MTERFDKAYNALVRAYFEGTLAANTCTACAVGNIVADAQGGKIEMPSYENLIYPKCNTDNTKWSILLLRSSIIDWSAYKHIDKELKELTGYNLQEVAKIERAFENNTKIDYLEYYQFTEKEILEDQYNGLSAVVDVLLKLDNEEPAPQYKAKFREHKVLQTS